MSKRVLSLFSGAGGAVVGFENAGYDVVAAVDFDEDCCATLETNHDDLQVIQEDLSETGPHEFALEYGVAPSDVDVVVGGPPCQGFSIAGERDEDDERNSLVEDFLDYVQFYEPSDVVMENVVGILSMEDGLIKEYVIERLTEMGYDASVDVHDATDFGVSQRRKRALFIGSHGQFSISPETEATSVSESIDHYPSLSAGECSNEYPNHEAPNHGDDMVERLSELERGKSLHGGQAFRKLVPDESSHTMTHNNNAPAVHYSEPRVITVREMASLQSFPDGYEFTGAKRKQYIQVGNALPPKMAEHIARAL